MVASIFVKPILFLLGKKCPFQIDGILFKFYTYLFFQEEKFNILRNLMQGKYGCHTC